jgi:hypothetical protein
MKTAVLLTTTGLCLATAFVMGIEGSLGFAFVALGAAYLSAVLTIVSIWMEG